MLKDKNIIIAVCGSIAAYKAAELVRLCIKAGAQVRVVMTADATAFISPLTLATLSQKPVLVNYHNSETGEWHNHVALGLWAHCLIIAPATANTIGKMANGICDNLLLAVYLSARCPVYIAPAMDVDMWQHPSTQHNIQKLISYNNIIIEPDYGSLASGLTGQGRLAEPENILSFVSNNIQKSLLLKGKNILISAGPTHESIDPVRFISNQSTGKMGYAIAQYCANEGAQVTLISGPTALSIQHQNIKKIDVITANDMFTALHQYFAGADACIMCAAVADYAVKNIANQKIKKNEQNLTLELVKTKDILASLGKIKTDKQLLIGFALETNNEENNAIKKLQQKNLDLIILNSLNDDGAGFKTDTNKITIIDKNLHKTTFSLKSKHEVAKDICTKIIQLF